MKKLILLFAFLALNLEAAQVRFALTNFNITTATNSIKIQPVGDPIANGSYLQIGLPVWVPMTNGIGTYSLLAGNYQIPTNGIQNYSLAKPMYFAVPNDTNTYDMTALLMSGANTYNYIPGVVQVIAGTNISISPASGRGPVTINADTSGASNFVNQVGQNVTNLVNLIGYGRLYVAANGNDGLGVRNRMDAPFATITAAANAALPGDWVIAYPQTYHENNLLRKGVNYDIWGPISYYESSLSGPCWGVFDDRPLGASTNQIILHDTATWNTGTNAIINTNDCTVVWGNTNGIGFFVQTNALSQMDMTYTRINVSGFSQGQAAVYSSNGRTNHMVGIGIDDPYAGITLSTNGGIICGTLTAKSLSVGLWWNLGDMYFQADSIDNMSLYAVDAYGIDSNDVANLWFRVHHFTGTYYCVGKTLNWKHWITFDEAESSPITQQQEVFILQGSGKYYIEQSGKVNATVPSSAAIAMNASGGLSNLQVWWDGQKVTSPGTWLRQSAGIIRFLSPIHFEQVGSDTGPGFLQTGGTLIVNGGDATNTNPVIYHNGGTAVFKSGFRGVTTGAASTVFVNGAGLTLNNSSLVSATSTNCIAATNAQTVGIVGTVTINTAPTANITRSPYGQINTDAANQ